MSGDASLVDIAGRGSAEIAKLGWLMISICALVYFATLAVFLLSVWRAKRRRRLNDAGNTVACPASDRGKDRWVTAAVLLTVAVLTLFVGASFITDQALVRAEASPTLRVEITAHQWWWEIRYLDPAPARNFVTANELHLPLGETVAITLRSPDVIHSFWVPALGPKRDVVPGRDQELRLTPTRSGAWPGRCSEYCGLQHARMGVLAVVEPRAAFDAWRAGQTHPARAARTVEEKRGEQVFASRACVLCHVIGGSAAGGYSATAPDLTHLKSRRLLAAGTLPNERAALTRWIVDPHRFKPGSRMPPNALAPDELEALVSYLEILE